MLVVLCGIGCITIQRIKIGAWPCSRVLLGVLDVGVSCWYRIGVGLGFVSCVIVVRFDAGYFVIVDRRKFTGGRRFFLGDRLEEI